MIETLPEDEPHARYNAAIKNLYAQGGSVSWSQQFEAAPPEKCTPADLASTVLDAVRPDVWTSGYGKTHGNWTWRSQDRPAQGTGELALERKVISTAREAGRTDWTYQMPTMSGVTGPDANKRRAIDLVHRVADGHYELIELKRTSNDPAHAAFEILFYGLAYLRAREHLDSVAGEDYAVLNARRIDFVVLAPRTWYRYTMTSGTFTVPYQLHRLTRVLNETLQVIHASLSLPGLDLLTFGFKVFEDEEQLVEDVRAGRSGKEYMRGGE